MIKSSHKKIAIIGNCGSGKTSLAFQLQEKLKLPLYHLDQYAWRPHWERVDFEQFSEAHSELCKKEEWILEGLYTNLLYQRISHADVVIFLDMPRFFCVWNVLKRAVLNFGKVIPGNPENCKQRIFSFKFLDFLKWVWNFNKRHRQAILCLLNDPEFSGKKQLYIFNSTAKIANFLQNLRE